MKVINETSFPIIAFGIDTEIGYGNDVTIQPGESKDVSGPYLGEMGGGSCHICIEGEVICQENPDDENGFRIAKGAPICLQADRKGVTIRHHEDSVEEHVIEWRAQNS